MNEIPKYVKSAFLDQLRSNLGYPFNYPDLKDIEEMITIYENTIKKLNEQLQQLDEENKYLKLDNPNQNIEHFRIIKENKRKIDALRNQNKQLKKQLQQRNEVIEKAIEKLSFIDDALEKDILNVPLCITKINKAIEILNKYKNEEND